jgi:hypothetical protein
MNNAFSMTMPTALSHVGRQNVNVASTLNTEPLFSNSGVTVRDCRPSYMAVDVSDLRTLKVNIAPPSGAFTIQNVLFDPPSVTVTGPAQDVDGLFPGSNAGIEVDLSGQEDVLRSPGSHTITVKLNLPLKRSDSVHITPTSVKMVFDVSSNDKESVLPPIAIAVQKLATQEGKQQIDIKGPPLLQNVRVRGPSSIVSKMEGDNPSIRPKAVLDITPDDSGTGITRNVTLIGIPPEVKILNGPFSVDFDVRDANTKPD